MERDGPTDLKWADRSNIPVGPNQNGPFLLISIRISGILGWMESAPVKVDYTLSWSVLLTRGLLPYISYIGMCRPIGSRFCAVLVWKRVWFSRVLPERMNVIYRFNSKWIRQKKNTRIRNAFEDFFCLRIKSKKWWRDFSWFLPKGQVWKRVWILEVWSENGSVKLLYFGLKWGKDLKNRAAHPHQEFLEVPSLGTPKWCSHSRQPFYCTP